MDVDEIYIVWYQIRNDFGGWSPPTIFDVFVKESAANRCVTDLDTGQTQLSNANRVYAWRQTKSVNKEA